MEHERGAFKVIPDWFALRLKNRPDNGALMVLPGSHLFFDKYRNNHIPVSYRGSESLILENMITVPMKAGQAFVLNHAVIHASTLNNTDKERLVIAYGYFWLMHHCRFIFGKRCAYQQSGAICHAL